MDSTDKQSRTSSRRQFLKHAPLMVAGALVLNTVGRAFSSYFAGSRKQLPNFPKGSIFTPAKDRDL